jgi:hypothetical protein
MVTDDVTTILVDPEVRALIVVVCRTLIYIVKWLKRRYRIIE